MKSSLCSDEIFGVPLQMNLNPPLLSRRSRISSRRDFIHDSGFIPQKADLVKKSTHCLGRQMCAFFWRRERNSFLNFSKHPIEFICYVLKNSSVTVQKQRTVLFFHCVRILLYSPAQKKNPPDWVGSSFVAEREGFEPSERY